MTQAEIRDTLIAAGVQNLKTFGYPHVTSQSILTDHIYKTFFLHMLESPENVGASYDIEKARQSLLTELGVDKVTLGPSN